MLEKIVPLVARVIVLFVVYRIGYFLGFSDGRDKGRRDAY